MMLVLVLVMLLVMVLVLVMVLLVVLVVVAVVVLVIRVLVLCPGHCSTCLLATSVPPACQSHAGEPVTLPA